MSVGYYVAHGGTIDALSMLPPVPALADLELANTSNRSTSNRSNGYPCWRFGLAVRRLGGEVIANKRCLSLVILVIADYKVVTSLSPIRLRVTISEMEEMTWKDFLEQVPPDQVRQVTDAIEPNASGHGHRWMAPALWLYCSSDTCDGERWFECSDGNGDYVTGVPPMKFLTYRCRNCGNTAKTYAVGLLMEEGKELSAIKLGELPSFGPTIPAKVIKLIGPDKDEFLKGRRAEAQGMGVAAFTYYRRVVERQKSRLISEMIRVCKATKVTAEVLAELERAEKETQFSKAIGQIKTGIPDALRINGQNPLTLLHSVLSDGLHDRPDKECLQLATDIRVVLTGMAERMSAVLKDHAELNDAVTRLLQKRSGQPPKATPSP